MSLLNKRADLVRVLEALYAPLEVESQWARELIGATASSIARAECVGLTVVGHGDGFAKPTVGTVVVSDPVMEGYIRRANFELARGDIEAFRTVYYSGRPLTTHRELVGELTAGQRFDPSTKDAGTGWLRDALGLFSYPEPGLAAVIFWVTTGRTADVPARERATLLRIASHFDAAYRVRTQPESRIAAVLGPDGALLDAGRDAVAARRAFFGARVTAIESARMRAMRSDPDALTRWRGLIDGQYTLVPREDTDGKRFYLLVDNPPSASTHSKLTAREADGVRLIARGLTGKEMAYAMGVSQPTVSETIARAAAKLGLGSRVDLAQVATAMMGSPAPRRARLTGAERAVLLLLRKGLSNAQIARLRERSERTVANQVSSLLAKTGSSSRRSLAARRENG